MKRRFAYRPLPVAFLIAGSATALFSCGSAADTAQVNSETLMTQRSDTLTLVYSENGVKQYRFYTPLMERYELAREPYMEFRFGVDVVTFDSLDNPESTLVSDYAIYYENRKLWEARGNVVATGQDDRTLYTQQLFWDQQTGRVYSNVDSKVVQDGDVFIGEGFESDDKFQNWTFRNYVGRITVDTTPSERSDSTGSRAASAAPSSEGGRQTAPRGSADGTARRQSPEALQPIQGSVRGERPSPAEPRTAPPASLSPRPEIARPVPLRMQPVAADDTETDEK